MYTETKVEMGRAYSKNEETIGGPNAAQGGSKGEGRDQEDNHVKDGKTT